MVVQFVAFVGAYRDPGDLDPWVAAIIAALLTTWVTFVPCFLFILLGAPYVERLRGNRALSTALTGHHRRRGRGHREPRRLLRPPHPLRGTTRVTTGPLDFEVPVLDSIQWAAVAITVLACALIFWRGWSVLRTLGACALAGLVIGTVATLS